MYVPIYIHNYAYIFSTECCGALHNSPAKEPDVTSRGTARSRRQHLPTVPSPLQRDSGPTESAATAAEQGGSPFH